MSGSVVASQLGARMHYAVPRILGEAGVLERFYTDICAVQGFPRLLALVPRRLQPRAIRRLAGRVPAVPGDKLRSFPLLGAYQVARRMRATAPADVTRLALLDGKAFSRAVAAAGFGRASGFYGIAGECLEQLAAAREMVGEAQFRMVGAIGAGLAGTLLWSPNLELCGAVPRAEMAAHFAWADVFLLPSACEGSATVTYEALAAGLPVVATPNAGSVVEHRVSGFVVPLGAIQPIITALRALAGDTARLDAMSAAARQRAADYDIAAYGRRLLAALAPLQRRTGGP
jgi:hypothetical protein